MILHIPHSSTSVPEDVRSSFMISDDRLAHELLLMTDAFTDELFDHPGATRVVYPVSRLVVDPERFPNDEDEPMSRVGMGAIYTQCADGSPLRRQVPRIERTALLDRYYWPHHRKLEHAVERELTQHGTALIIDCHSFPSVPHPCAMDKTPNRSRKPIPGGKKSAPGQPRRSAKTKSDCASEGINHHPFTPRQAFVIQRTIRDIEIGVTASRRMQAIALQVMRRFRLVFQTSWPSITYP